MTKLNAATLAAVVLTALMLQAMSYLPAIPVWAIFISWACFFHLGGGEDRNQAWRATMQHVGLGIATAWLSALMVLHNPFEQPLIVEWWASVVIGLVIGVLFRLSVLTRFAVTPAIVYGYAGTFAFLSVPGKFSTEILLSFTFDNVLVAMGISLILGVIAGYINALVIDWLCSLSLAKARQQAPSHH